MSKVGEKVKQFGESLTTLGPIVAGVIVSYAAVLGYMFVSAFAAAFQMAFSGGAMDTVAIMDEVMSSLMANLMNLTFVSQILNLIVFVIWYRLLGNKKFVNPVKVIKLPNVGVIALLGVGLQLLTNIALSLVSVFVPETIEEYIEMMEMAGLGEVNLVTVLATVIMAPLVEELMFRGVTLQLANRAGLPFILGNIIQAVLFGVYHGNLVQGVYAGILGLVLGYVAHRYRSLWASILLHLVFNLSSIIISLFAEFLPESIGTYIGFAVVGVICVIGAMLIMKKEQPVVKEAVAASQVAATTEV